MTKASSFVKDAALERFLKRLPDDIANSFTIEQLQAMQTGLQATQWRRHPVDIRMTIPVLWKKFYFVLVAGPEKRSKIRRASDRVQQPIWTLANVLFVICLTSTGILLSLGLFQLKMISLGSLTKTTTYPAGIPFKESPEACEESGRAWRNGECIDYGHDATF